MENTLGKEKNPYAGSVKLYIPACAIVYLISLITSGAYLAKLTTTIGISDGMTAILSSIASLACLFQFVSIPLSHRARSKGTVIVMATFNQLLYSFLYLVPFLGFSVAINSAIFFLCILSSMALNQISSPLSISWFYGMMRPEERGSFASINQIVSYLCGFAFSFAASVVADKFTAAGNVSGMFLTFAVTILVLNVIHFTLLFIAKEKPRAPVLEKRSVLADFKELLKIKSMRKYLLFSVVNTIGASVVNPFFGTYQIRELGLSMTQVTVMTTVTSVSAVLFLALFGAFARKHTLIRTMKIGYPITVLSYLFIVFCTPQNGMLMFILYYVIYAFGNAAFSLGNEAIPLEIAEEEYHTATLAMKNAIAGPIGFLTTTALTPLLAYIQKNGNSFLGISIYGQQLFAIVAMVILSISCLLFFSFARTHVPVHQRDMREDEGT